MPPPLQPPRVPPVPPTPGPQGAAGLVPLAVHPAAHRLSAPSARACRQCPARAFLALPASFAPSRQPGARHL
eukprot:12643859-Alexandrium_andersonii.AAC.1